MIDLAAAQLGLGNNFEGQTADSRAAVMAAHWPNCETFAPETPTNYTVLGWAAPTERLCLADDNCISIGNAATEDCDRLLIWAALLRVLQGVRTAAIAPGELICVLGTGLMADLTARFLELFTWAGGVERIVEVSPVTSAPCDVLLSFSSDNRLLAQMLVKVRPRGRVVFMAPAYRAGQSFNFYPDIHRHSLRVQSVRGIYQPASPGVRDDSSKSAFGIAGARTLDLLNYYSQSGWLNEFVVRLSRLPKIDLIALDLEQLATDSDGLVIAQEM